MARTTRSTFALRPHDATGAWTTDDRRHAESAEQLLIELEAVSAQVVEQWPLGPSETVRDAEADHPQLYALVRRCSIPCEPLRVMPPSTRTAHGADLPR